MRMLFAFRCQVCSQCSPALPVELGGVPVFDCPHCGTVYQWSRVRGETHWHQPYSRARCVVFPHEFTEVEISWLDQLRLLRLENGCVEKSSQSSGDCEASPE